MEKWLNCYCMLYLHYGHSEGKREPNLQSVFGEDSNDEEEVSLVLKSHLEHSCLHVSI